ncbi:uncharacterized protein LOC134184960 isoform X2 [Corticium candelabrum]|uniref:uncharacterized protein LOC134184960 isoform X2 n=1 Tax=Corticium candelabrum TaxID=121492 RepID=UPI002E325358|nr:uncharacterized protein LOC134184960 isoform X2 [Corticium candelabrum]
MLEHLGRRFGIWSCICVRFASISDCFLGTTRHQSPLPHPTPLQYGLLHSPPAVPRKPPEHDRLPVARHRLASSATQQSADSGVGVCSIASALSEIGLKEQKERAIGTVRVTRSYHSNVEEGMLQLKVGQTVYILSHADDGKWYGIAGDQIGFFYITSVDHDNITWQENWQQSVEVQRAEVIRDSTPDRDDIGFLQVKVHDEVYVLAMPDSGLWTAEKDSCVGYIYSSDLQLLGEESKGWDHAPAEEHWSRRMRTTSIYTQPHHVKFYGRAVKSNSLTGPNALHFKANDRIGIIDSPSTTSSGLWFGKLGRKAGKFLFSDVEVESYAGLEEIREVSSHKSTTLSHSVRLPVHQKVIDEMKSQTLPQRRTHDISHTSSTPILPPRGAARIQGFGQHHFSKPTRGSQVPSLPENVNRRFDNL